MLRNIENLFEYEEEENQWQKSFIGETITFTIKVTVI